MEYDPTLCPTQVQLRADNNVGICRVNTQPTDVTAVALVSSSAILDSVP